MLISKIISGIVHPLLMPIYCIFIIFNANSPFLAYPIDLVRIIYIIVAICTVLMPLVMLPVLKYFRIITSYEFYDKNQRIMPLVFSVLFYYFAFFLLRKINLGNIFPNLIFASIVSIMVCLLVSLKWKISLHMAAIGGIIGFIFAFAYKYSVDLSVFFIISINIAGILAYARLKLNKHKPMQVYIGFATGLVIISSLIIIL